MGEPHPIGRRLARPDALPRVTGQARYAEDIYLPGMLHAVAVRSPHSHARVIEVETPADMPGVRAVLTPANCALLPSEILYAGQKVAVLAAADRHAAVEAAQQVRVTYEELPAVFDPLDAFMPGAPQVRPSRLPQRPNVCSFDRKQRGDVDAALEAADVVVEETYHVGAAHQAYLEPHACVARFDSTGQLTVWASIQGQFPARAELARLLDLPVHRVRVIATEVGGAFGGKTALIMEPFAALLARQTGAPVKMVMSRWEELADSHPGPACVVSVRTGARRDGSLVGEWAQIVYDTGAAPGAPAGNFDRCRGLYRIPAFQYDIYSVYTNKLVPGAYRAPGALELTFAFEAQIDALARSLGIDPIELRLRNAVDEGDASVDGRVYPAIGLRESLRQARQYVGELKPAANRYTGVASGKWMNAVGASGVVVMLNEDGSASITSGAVDLTGVNTALAQVVAAELTLPVDTVHVRTRGTDASPYASISGGSRTTYGMTLATRLATDRLRAEVLDFAAQLLDADAAHLCLRQGRVCRGDSPTEWTLPQLAALATQAERGPFTATGSVSAREWLADSHIFITQVAQIDLDPDTGRWRVVSVASFQDVGRAINPMLVEGQIEGGVVQGLGWGMLEDLTFADGTVLNDGLLDYRIPTALDAPEVQPVLIEVPSPSGPYGIKGVGEPSMVVTPAAVANAVYAATGRRLTRTPLCQGDTL